MKQVIKLEVQNILEKELERLKHKLQMGYELKVIWFPDGDGKLSGEVKGDTIFVYDATEDEALESLRHEFLDSLMGKIIEPYRKVSNVLISIINEDAYRKKERLIETLVKVL